MSGKVPSFTVPFRSLHYYHPAQEGSASIKADGGEASREYARVIFGSNIDPKDRQKVRQALEKYLSDEYFEFVRDKLKAILSRAGIEVEDIF